MGRNDFVKAHVANPPAPPLLPIGHVVAGRYEVMRLIGAGGAGEVYEALDTGLGVNVALKVLNPVHARNAVQLERFRREIQSARKVTHRNVCRIFDLGVERVRNMERFFLTMELLPGPPGRGARPAAPYMPGGGAADRHADRRGAAGGARRRRRPPRSQARQRHAGAGSTGGGGEGRPPRAVITDFGLA